VAVAETRSVAPEEKAVSRATPADPVNKVKLTHQVKRGDTLFSVARLYRTTVASLKAWNRLTRDYLMPGSRLTVFASRNNHQRP